MIENKIYDELAPGMSAELRRVCTVDDFYVFATASGNHNPMHLPKEDGDGDGKPELVAPSMWVASLVSAVLGNVLPGPGTLYRSQTLTFSGYVTDGDELVARVVVRELGPDRQVTLDTSVETADGRVIVTGEAVVVAPTMKLHFNALDVPGLIVQRHRHFDQLLEVARGLPPTPTAVVAPEEPKSLGGALLAAQEGLILPILVGARDKIEATAAEIGADLSGIEIIDAPEHPAAAVAGVALVRQGRAHALMKGHLHTDELLHAALSKETGLRAGRRFTHVFVMDVPGLSHPVLVTDAAINIAPDITTKVDIVQNAIDLAIALGIQQPKVGILSAVETVNPQIVSSVDAALLSKMAERGQIRGGIVDGPLAMDNAVDIAAARTKGIVSPVAGHAEILVVPDLDAGNMLAKQLIYVGKAESAGLVMGARAPIILTSRADDEKSRLVSCAVAVLYAAHTRGIKGA